jgi:hypothetical protein
MPVPDRCGRGVFGGTGVPRRSAGRAHGAVIAV